MRTDCTISSPSSFAYPVVAVSLGKPHVFDSRKKTCIVSKDSLSFGVFSQGEVFLVRSFVKVYGYPWL